MQLLLRPCTVLHHTINILLLQLQCLYTDKLNFALLQVNRSHCCCNGC